MKNIIYTIALFLIFFLESSFTQNLTDIARSKEITWYGVDFTQSRFIGFELGELNKFSISSWSYTTLTDYDKNLIRRSFGKKTLYDETTTAQNRNSILDCKSLSIKNTYEINIDIIKKVVADYNIKGDGYGVLFIVESIEKIQNSIFIWVVYIDKSSGQVISSRRYIGGGYGGSWKNYSKGGVELVIKLSGKDLKLYK